MREQWLHEAVADLDRQDPRAEFKGELREQLSSEWGRGLAAPNAGGRARRWWLLGATALVTAVVATTVIGLASVNSNEPDTALSPAPTSLPATPASTVAPTTMTSPVDVATTLIDRTWLITEVNGEPRTYVASFTIDEDGVLSGHDGCNFYSNRWEVDVDQLTLRDGGTETTAALCSQPYTDGWMVMPGTLAIVGDALTLTTDDGDVYAAVDLASLETVSSADQLAGTWETAEGLQISFEEDGTISMLCGTVGSWTLDGITTDIDQNEFAACLEPDGPSLQWILDSLIDRQPVIHILPDSSLVFGTRQFGRLFPAGPSGMEPAGVLTRPILETEYCNTLWVTESPAAQLDITFFARSSELPIPVQVIGSPDEDITKPYALVLRYFDPRGRPNLGDNVQIEGRETSIFIGEYGQGQASWILPDGSEAYIRSRGLSREELIAYAAALQPRDAGSKIPGFDVVGDLPDSATLIGESMGPVAGGGSRSNCLLDEGFYLQIGLLQGDVVYRFGAAIDFIPLPLVRQIGEDQVLLTIPTGLVPETVLDDVTDATPEQWDALLIDVDSSELGVELEANLSEGTIWGLGIGRHTPAEAHAAQFFPVGPVLDTDWFVTGGSDQGKYDCLIGLEQRILWWGDTSVAFSRSDDGAVGIWSWTVGDVRASGYGDRRQPNFQQPTSRFGTRTEFGIAVGSSVDDFLASHGGTLTMEETESDGSRVRLWSPDQQPGTPGQIALLVAPDGTIDGFGATRKLC